MLRVICAATLVIAAPAMSATRPSTAGDAMMPADVSCADFIHNPNGSWTPSKTVKMGSVKLKAGKPLAPGTMVGGIDIAAHLTDACSKADPTT